MATALEKLRERRGELLAQVDTNRARGTELLARSELTTDETAELERLTAAGTDIRARVAQVETQIADEETAEQRAATLAKSNVETGQTRAGGASVGNEPRTYSAERDRTGEVSFFVDAFRSQVLGAPESRTRLERHGAEVRADAARGGVETRATTTGSYGGLVVPQYLADQYALALRAGRPTANVVNRVPLPAQGMTITVPRNTTGAGAASQATENTALQNTDEVWADLSVPVRTIGGQQDVSRQSLERGTPGIDQIVFADLARAYNAELDRQVVTGSGASGQMLGIASTSGIGASTAYGAAVAAGTFYLKSAGQLSAVAGAGTDVQPEVWVMHPRRWYWLTAQLDTQGRPLVVPAAGEHMAANAMGINALPGGYSADSDANPPKIVGYFHGIPVILDANVPTTVGTPSEDIALAMDPKQAWLWEDGDGTPRQLKFEQTAGGNLTVKLVLYGYAAFTAGRYPAAFGKVGGADTVAGQGQIAPTF